jgi:hypothetical protein
MTGVDLHLGDEVLDEGGNAVVHGSPGADAGSVGARISGRGVVRWRSGGHRT